MKATRPLTLASVLSSLSSLALATACAPTDEPTRAAQEEGSDGAEAAANGDLGGRFDDAMTQVTFRVRSARATRIEVWVYSAPLGEAERARYTLANEGGDRWSVAVPVSELRDRGVADTIYYGYRAWGPNWTFDAGWTPGTGAGFVADVDDQGNRFNPNKLLFDPYALEISHDPINPSNASGSVFQTGPTHRLEDSGTVAPKGIVLADEGGDVDAKPTRALSDDVIYEVHVRGFTNADSSVPAGERGTFAGAARKAEYLRSIGVTAVEFLPVQETTNDANDVVQSTAGDNYWGYMTLAYFAPDRRYAADRSPGGPSREFRAMTRAFHDQGIKVFIDVVYNHSAEGGTTDGAGDVTSLFSMRGLDSRSYYELADNPHKFFDNTGIGAN